MANVVSPQVVTREVDVSFVAPAVSTTITGIIGGATKGPVNKAQFVTTPAQFIELFGKPTPKSYLGYTAINFLQRGNQLWVIRAASEQGTDPVNTATTDTAAVYTSDAISTSTISGDLVLDIDGTSLSITVPASTSVDNAVALINTALSTGYEPRLGTVKKTTSGSDSFIVITTESRNGELSTITVDNTSTLNGFVVVSDTTVTGSKTAECLTNLSSAKVTSNNVSSTVNTNVAFTSETPAPSAFVITGGTTATWTPTNTSVSSVYAPSSLTVTVKVVNGSTSQTTVLSGFTKSGSNASLTETADLTGITFAGRVDSTSGQVIIVMTGAVGDTLTAVTATAGYVRYSSTVNNKVSLLIDGTYTVDATLTQTASLSLSNLVAQINTAANAVDISLADIASLDTNVTPNKVVITSPTAGYDTTVQGLNSKIEILKQPQTTVYTNAITAVADNGSGFCQFTSTGHTFVVGDTVLVSGAATSSLNTVHLVTAVAAGTFDTDVAYAASSFTSGLGSKLTGLFTSGVNPSTIAVGSGTVKKSIRIEAAYPGTWANDVITVAFTDENPLFFAPNSSRVDVFENGGLVETFREVTLDPTADGTTKGPSGKGIFLEKAINGVSSYIRVDFDDLATDSDPDTINGSAKIRETTSAIGVRPPYKLAGGADGLEALSSDEIIGQAGAEPTGLQIFDNAETMFLNLLAAPGFSDQSIGNELIRIAEHRGDTLAIIDPPFGLKAGEVVDWHNGKGGHGRTAALNSSYGAVYGTWLKSFDAFNNAEIYLPPSAYILPVIAYNDSVAEAWYAPAGLTRGKIGTALDVAYNPTIGERETMYGNGNAVNPIVNFVQDGIVVWGQRTLQRQPSALDRINVRRLLNYAKVVIGLAAKVILFEPNDIATRNRLARLVNPVLQDIKNRRGLIRFKVEDATTSKDIALNRITMRIYLQPTQSVEIIDIPFVITAAGASFTI